MAGLGSPGSPAKRDYLGAPDQLWSYLEATIGVCRVERRGARSSAFGRVFCGRGKALSKAVPVVDLFSGPGGLAEGFARCRGGRSRVRFEVALSVEMERSAHKTLLMRAFLRKFGQDYPSEYHSFLNRGAIRAPDWQRSYPKQWAEAADETQRLELGTPGATKEVDKRIHRIRERQGPEAVLLGGPPCQSYSLVGRARNVGNANYDPAKDTRQSLYFEYVRILAALRPAVAVMENVKGMLSARLGDDLVIEKVLKSLRHATGTDSYRLYTVAGPDSGLWKDDRRPSDFLVRADEHGVPQARHRVIVVCVRSDIAKVLPVGDLLRLEKSDHQVPVKDVIGQMPRLRSRISRADNSEAWRDVVVAACKRLGDLPMPRMTSDQMSRFRSEILETRDAVTGSVPEYGNTPGGTEMACPDPLRTWIRDPRVTQLPNNETRRHMPADIERYLFASAFAKAKGVSPKASDFPEILAPNHANWGTGKFADRFRVQVGDRPSSTVTSHMSKDGHYFIHPDPTQCRSLTVREAARLQTFPDDYFFMGDRTRQYVQVGNAVPPYLALQIARCVADVIGEYERTKTRTFSGPAHDDSVRYPEQAASGALVAAVT